VEELSGRPNSYLSPKLEGRQSPGKGGRGVFACAPIRAGEIVAVWGGDVVTGEELARFPQNRLTSLAVQVDENLYLVTTKEGPGDWINHSCNPNAGLRGQITLVAIRDITPGEEVCIDYAMTDGSPYDEFECECGAPDCRGRVSGDDWRNPALWEKYAGFFSPYLQRRIERLKQEAEQS
jgi:hypothetical protein